MERQVTQFEMPGLGIPNFKEHAAAIARAGIYNVEQHHQQVLVPLLRHWGVETVQGRVPFDEPHFQLVVALQRPVRGIQAPDVPIPE